LRISGTGTGTFTVIAGQNRQETVGEQDK